MLTGMVIVSGGGEDRRYTIVSKMTDSLKADACLCNWQRVGLITPCHPLKCIFTSIWWRRSQQTVLWKMPRAKLHKCMYTMVINLLNPAGIYRYQAFSTQCSTQRVPGSDASQTKSSFHHHQPPTSGGCPVPPLCGCAASAVFLALEAARRHSDVASLA